MKKLSVLTTLTLSGILFSSCSMQSHVKKKPSQELANLMETVEINEDDIFEKEPQTGEYTHELAEADADDNKITAEVGDAEIDKELPGSENDQVPYAKNFLKMKKTKRMQFWVDYFTKKNRDRFQRFINNGEEYRPIIEKIFEEHGLPKELYFVGLIESGYYLSARSHASAVGPWQFIKGTGKRYGLKITNEIDERQDLFKSSRAAAMYFKDLNNVFSSWELALAAYNAGEYGIIRRIMKHGTRDFYELSRNKQLPSETINYVPKVLAAMHVVNNAEKYGFSIPKKKHRLFDLTELKPIKKNVPLATIAKRLNVSVELLKKLNPELRQDKTPKHFAGTYYLRIPQSRYSYNIPEADTSAPVVAKTPGSGIISKPETKKELVRRTAEVQVEAKPKFHKVTRGETLISIARKYKTTPRELAEINKFKSWKTQVRIGQNLKITQDEAPKVAVTTAPVKARTPASSARLKVTNKPIVYKVNPGDNLTQIAKLFDTNIEKIKKANNLKREKVFVGQKIVLPDTRKAIYTVKKGDHLTKVARELKQPLDAIIKINSLKRGTIYPGQKIIVNMD